MARVGRLRERERETRVSTFGPPHLAGAHGYAVPEKVIIIIRFISISSSMLVVNEGEGSKCRVKRAETSLSLELLENVC